MCCHRLMHGTFVPHVRCRRYGTKVVWSDLTMSGFRWLISSRTGGSIMIHRTINPLRRNWPFLICVPSRKVRNRSTLLALRPRAKRGSVSSIVHRCGRLTVIVCRCFDRKTATSPHISRNDVGSRLETFIWCGFHGCIRDTASTDKCCLLQRKPTFIR